MSEFDIDLSERDLRLIREALAGYFHKQVRTMQDPKKSSGVRDAARSKSLKLSDLISRLGDD